MGGVEENINMADGQRVGTGEDCLMLSRMGSVILSITAKKRSGARRLQGEELGLLIPSFFNSYFLLFLLSNNFVRFQFAL